jgi:hypothetical protein
MFSTVLNFLYIPTKDQYVWMPTLIWSVMLWQNFLGWWWWVGSGTTPGAAMAAAAGSTTGAKSGKKEGRREKRRLRAVAARRGMGHKKSRTFWRDAAETVVPGFMRKDGKDIAGTAAIGTAEAVENEDQEWERERERARALDDAASERTVTNAMDAEPSSSPSLDAVPDSFPARLLHAASRPFQPLFAFFHLLRQKHVAAERLQALERMRRRREAYGSEVRARAEARAGAGVSAEVEDGVLEGFEDRVGDEDEVVRDSGVLGWGLGSFWLRDHRRHHSNPRCCGTGTANARVPSSDLSPERGGSKHNHDHVDDVEIEKSGKSSAQAEAQAQTGSPSEIRNQLPRPPPAALPRLHLHSGGTTMRGSHATTNDSSGWSIMWWGPLRRWRLQDSTSY